MAYSKRTWVDRDVEYPNRRTLTNVSTGVDTDFDVAFNEGDVYVAGDKINATNMNDLEDRIDDAFSALPPVDTAMSDSSTNPVQNRVIKAYVDEKDTTVSVVPLIAEGVDIATITVDGTPTTIKAPAQESEIDDSSTASNKTWSANKIGTELGTKADSMAVGLQLALKADKVDTYNKSAVDNLLDAKADKSTTYTKSAVDTMLETKADIDGSYDGMTVGNAKQLVSTISETDVAPFLFRTSGGSIDIGESEVDKIVGGTVAFNQQIQNGNFSDGTTGWSALSPSQSSLSVVDNTLILTHTATSNRSYGVSASCAFVANHKYLIKGTAKKTMVDSDPDSKGFKLYCDTDLLNTYSASQNDVVTLDTIVSILNSGTLFKISFLGGIGTAASNDSMMEIKNINIIDLTQMFGSTIADYIYSLEQGTAGAGVAYFRKLFPKSYYAYNAGELMSVKTSAHNMTGFNQWDEEYESGTFDQTTGEKIDSSSLSRSKNAVKVIPNTVYYCERGTGSGRLFFYDANMTLISSLYRDFHGTFTTPLNCAYMTFAFQNAVFNNNICINLSWDGERNGEYEPYVKHEYPLDSSLELRGIPKLDSSNNLYYDGDTYESDGTVTRRYGIVDLGTQTWTKSTSGSFTFFYTPISGIKRISTSSETINLLVFGNYKSVAQSVWSSNIPCVCKLQGDNNDVLISDHNFDDKTGEQVATALSGVYLVYEIATPTTETAEPFTNPQIVDDFGTEEYVDTRAVAIPVGHETEYQPNLRAKLEMSPDSPSADGDYLMRHANGENSYVAFTKELPPAPTTDGTYTLKCTVASGTPTYFWVADT